MPVIPISYWVECDRCGCRHPGVFTATWEVITNLNTGWRIDACSNDPDDVEDAAVLCPTCAARDDVDSDADIHLDQ